MDPVFTLPYSEFVVAQRLSRLLPPRDGFSIHTPLSRQEPGVDLVVLRRNGRHTRSATVQVKSSRTYSRRTQTERTRRPFRFYTWFNTFECPPQADFFCLVALFPAVVAAQRRELGTWWAPQVLLFSHREMDRFLKTVRTVAGKRDRMFGFGFDRPVEVFQTRGDRARRYRDYSAYLLERHIREMRRFLGVS